MSLKTYLILMLALFLVLLTWMIFPYLPFNHLEQSWAVPTRLVYRVDTSGRP